MVDFLTFKQLISIEVLIVFYYLGAVVMPIFIWQTARWLIHKFDLIKLAYHQEKERLWHALSTSQKIKVTLFIVTLFLFTELFWRMLFEFLIAYLQIRDALVLPH